MKLRGILAILLLATTSGRAEVKTQEIDYEIDGKTYQGYFAYDHATEGKRPGVLVIHEWRGHDEYARKRTEQLAQEGYAAFALDMYGKGILAANSEEAGKLAGELRNDLPELRKRAQRGFEVLKEQSQVDASRTAAIGYCFGGTAALELARNGADVAGVVSFHGGLETVNPEDAKSVKAKVLVLHGWADPAVPPSQVEAFAKEMTDAGVDWHLVAYGGAVHGFTNPKNPVGGQGRVGYDPTADRRSWEHMKLFFEELFR